MNTDFGQKDLMGQTRRQHEALSTHSSMLMLAIVSNYDTLCFDPIHYPTPQNKKDDGRSERGGINRKAQFE